MPTPVWTLLGKASPAGSGTTIPVTLTRAQDAGTIIVVDASLAASAGTASATCSDNRSGGNSYHLDNVGNNGNRPIAVLSCKPGTLLQSGDVVTVANLVSGSSRGALVWQVTNLDQTTWLVNATGAGASSTTPDSGTLSLVAGDYALHGTLASSNAATASVSDNNQGGTYSAGDTAGNVACEQMQVTPGSTLSYKARMSQTSTAYYMGLTVYKVAAGGTTITKTPSGGIVLGGSAAQARTIAKAPSGGIVLGGSASKTRSITAAKSGGIVLGGSAAEARSIARTASGGIVLGGSAAQARSIAKSPSGGIVLGGSASKSLDKPLAGGIVLGGSASYSRTVAATASGGIVLGGSAAEARTIARTASGGIVLGGSASKTRSITATCSGGIVLGGSATYTSTTGFVTAPSGGIVLGGTSTLARAIARTCSGGIVLGGSVAVTRTVPYAVTGGIVLGGSASYSIGPTPTPPADTGGGGGGSGFPADWFDRMLAVPQAPFTDESDEVAALIALGLLDG